MPFCFPLLFSFFRPSCFRFRFLPQHGEISPGLLLRCVDAYAPRGEFLEPFDLLEHDLVSSRFILGHTSRERRASLLQAYISHDGAIFCGRLKGMLE